MSKRRFPSHLFSLEERVQVWEDAGRMCHYCDKPVPKPGTQGGRRTHFDHIVPDAKQGDHDLKNLVVCCRRCNLDKGKKDYILFLQGKREASLKQVRRLSKLIARYNHGQTKVE